MDRFVSFAALVAVLFAAVAHAADPPVVCESGKLKTAGKYASCLLGANSKAVKSGGSPDYTTCDSKFAAKWSSIEAKATAGVCPGGDLDQTAIGDFIDICDQAVAAALAGDAPLPADVATCNSALTTCGGSLTTCNGSLGTCNTNYTTCSGSLTTCNGNLGTCTGDLTDCNTDLSSTNADLTTCQGDLATCEVAPAAQTLKTGQTLCYTPGGSPIPCAGTGQDGDLQTGVARFFTDNGDGTITDNRTGLMWEKLSNDGTINDKDNTYSWANAFATKVAGLNTASFAGHTDWRVPNPAELETLRKLGTSGPATYPEFNTACPASCTVMTCNCTLSANYWSSSTWTVTPSDAWFMSMNSGTLGQQGKTSTSGVRAVRTAATTVVPQPPPLSTGQTACYDTAGSVISCAGSGQDGDLQKGAARSFTDNGDGTVTDDVTGLTWEKLSDDGTIHDKDNTYTWANAFASKIATLNSSSFAGSNDWRVPNRNELETLVNSGTFNPAAYSAFNASCIAACTGCSCTISTPFWSATTYPGGTALAWYVNFYAGSVDVSGKTSPGYVRAVRGGS